MIELVTVYEFGLLKSVISLRSYLQFCDKDSYVGEKYH